MLCQLETLAQVIQWDISTGLHCLNKYNAPFNLVFMDPPYHSNLVAVGLKHIQTLPILSPGNLLVVEHFHKESLPSDTINLNLIDQRHYGKTLVSILEFVL
jgi:16S rRNA G966 N2-methylase RsmD